MPLLTVIIPAHRCARTLERAISAVRASDLPAEQWELVVVDDGSNDETAGVAQALADRAVVLAGSPRGPAYARNRGAEIARGSIVVFLDADVLVHPDALRRMKELFVADESVGAVFGAYDTHPAAPGLVSRYRNLMHHYVHSSNAGDAETFWAGCGAVRKSLFINVGGFDERRYTRPQIEDIELGHRLRDEGARVLLVPSIQCTHLKRWTLRSMIRADVRDRGVPWIQLLLEERDRARSSTLNLQDSEKLFTVFTWLAIASAVAAIALRDQLWAFIAIVLLVVVLLGNAPMLGWFWRTKGAALTLVAVPLRLLHYLLCGVAVALGLWSHLRHPRRYRRATRYMPVSHHEPTHVAEDRIERVIALAFAPMDKMAFGVATGIAAGVLVYLVTAVRLVRLPAGITDLSLLAQFFTGYSESWAGAAIGLAWGFATGCIAGWFAAFLRNFIMATWLLVARVRVELTTSRDFLDHI